MKKLLLTALLFFIIMYIALGQPGDPSGDPDNDTTKVVKEKEFSFIKLIEQKGELYLVVYFHDNTVVKYKRKRKLKQGLPIYEFY